MSKFLSKLVLSPMPDGAQYALQTDLVYESTLIDKITVPAGFVTDLASIPRALWVVFPPFGRYSAAAILHDWLYWAQTCTTQQANDVLHEAMQLLGCDEAAVHAIYAAVNLFGAPAWQRNKEIRAAGYARMSTGPDLCPYAGVPT